MKKLSIMFIFLSLGMLFSCSKGDSDETPAEQDILQAVDLGLSVKWASHNVGAKSKYELGYFFAWGETTPRTNFNESNYKYYKNEKYADITNKGKMEIDIMDDAARSNMKGNWRMPTMQEFEELFNKCAWKWKEKIDNGILIKGFEVTGPSNNTIFIPKGERDINNNTYGDCYMSSTIEYDSFYSDHCAVRGLCIEDNRQNVFWSARFLGNLVRAVCE